MMNRLNRSSHTFDRKLLFRVKHTRQSHVTGQKAKASRRYLGAGDLKRRRDWPVLFSQGTGEAVCSIHHRRRGGLLGSFG